MFTFDTQLKTAVNNVLLNNFILAAKKTKINSFQNLE